MKSLKGCDLCENVMKLMCLAPALGGTPASGTKSDAFLAPSTSAFPEHAGRALRVPSLLGTESVDCSPTPWAALPGCTRLTRPALTRASCVSVPLAPDPRPGEPGVMRFMGSLL